MDLVYRYGAQSVDLLQKINAPSELFILASHFADPPAVNLIAFPVAFFVHPILGSATLLSINFSEWLNGVLKWILDDDRPYWWVQTHHQKGMRINLKQFPLTCETGPGSPSGHCMVMVAGWLPLLLHLKSRHRRLGSVLLFLFIACIILVAVSRVYIATHFPHQVLLGSTAGAIIGLLFYRWTLYFERKNIKSVKKFTGLRLSIMYSPRCLIAAGILSFIVGKVIGGLLNYLGIDVERSFRLSAKYCARPEWLHSSTSVMASYARVTGALIGLAGAFLLRPLSPRTSKPIVSSFWEIMLSCLVTSLMYYVFHQVIFLVSPVIKGIVEPFSFNSDFSFLFYMAARGSIPPLTVAFVFSSLHDRFCTRQNIGFHSQNPQLRNCASTVAANGGGGAMNSVHLRKSHSRR
ncbi:hypothetical protein Aperf_G00000077089 [Anoplocephala perfoliata]